MATQRYISTSFWDDAWVQTLKPSEKFLYLYLMTNPLTNIAGVYKITIRRMCFDTGYDEKTINGILKKFKIDKKVYLFDDYLIIPSWPKHQKWQVKKTIKSGIEAILKELSKEVLSYMISIDYLYPIDTLPLNYTYEPSYIDSDIDSDIDIDIDYEEKNTQTQNQEKKSIKASYGEFGKVRFTDEEFLKIEQKHGKAKAELIIEKLDSFKAAKGKEYKSDYAAVSQWVAKAVDEDLTKNPDILKHRIREVCDKTKIINETLKTCPKCGATCTGDGEISLCQNDACRASFYHDGKGWVFDGHISDSDIKLKKAICG